MENGWFEDKSDDEGVKKLYPSVDTVVPIKESRAAKNDLIICCTKKNPNKNEITTKRFGVEKAVVAWQSIFFDNMFDSCDKSIDEGQIQVPEQADVVEAFLKCIYGIDSDLWAFDLCIDVIEMARNYEARIVERQAYFRLCTAFEALSKEGNGHSMYTKYGKLYILKFMQFSRQAQKEKFAEAPFLIKTLKEKSKLILMSCGMKAATELNIGKTRYCTHCRRLGEVAPGTTSSFNFSMNHLFTAKERSFFSIYELLEFKLCLILYATSSNDDDIYEYFVNEHL